MNATIHECSECGTLNNTVVNPERCWSCGHEWPEERRGICTE